MLKLRQWIVRVSLMMRGFQSVGRDTYGNRYFVKGDRRLVVYAGFPEPSSVCATWHGWLHGSLDHVPEAPLKSVSWHRKHLSNRSGTVFAHMPPGISRAGSPALKKPYRAWTPTYHS